MKKRFIISLLTLSLALLCWHLSTHPVMRLLEHKLYDLRMLLRQQPHQDNRILYVEMDEEALETIGRWPWSRATLAHIVDTLHDLGAAQVLLDITFSQTSPLTIKEQDTTYLTPNLIPLTTFLHNTLKADQPTAPDWKQIDHKITELQTQLQHNINFALINNDALLAKSFQHPQTYIGYKFDILYKEENIQYYNHLQHKKNVLNRWIVQHPNQPFDTLPNPLRYSPHLSEEKLKTLYRQQQLRFILNENLETSLENAAKHMKMNTSILRSDFIAAKKQVAQIHIRQYRFNTTNPSLEKLIWQLEIWDPEIVETFRQEWNTIDTEITSLQQFGLDIQTPQPFHKAIEFDPPLRPFAEAVTGAGFLNGIPDDDGVLRRIPLFIQYQDKLFPHIALTSVLNILNPKSISIIPHQALLLKKVQTNNGIKDISIPLIDEGHMMINWAGKWHDTFDHISSADIYRLFYLRQHQPSSTTKITSHQEQTFEKTLRKQVNNKICIIGLTAPGTHDYNPMPYESSYPMVGTHGNVINAILTNQMICKTSSQFNIILLGFCTILLSVFLTSSTPLISLLFISLLVSALWITALHLLNQGFWMPLAMPLCLCVCAFISITLYRFATEEKEKRWIKKAFSQYVSSDVIEEILQDPSKLGLSGERRTMSVLFSDIRGFTTYCEKHAPEEIVTILNEYLDAMTHVIFEEKGTLDKYVGDEIMALFGAPKYESPTLSAKRAVRTAWLMIKKLQKLQKKWRQENREPLDIGIGINTGEMVVGNIGSNLRKDYTVIGDAVNLGARVEALTRQFECPIIITATTYQYVKDLIEVKPLEAIKVKGKNIPVMIYAVTDCAITPKDLHENKK